MSPSIETLLKPRLRSSELRVAVATELILAFRCSVRMLTSSGRPAAARPTLDHLRAADLHPYGSQDPQEEQVQERQQAELEDREQLLVHVPETLPVDRPCLGREGGRHGVGDGLDAQDASKCMGVL